MAGAAWALVIGLAGGWLVWKVSLSTVMIAMRWIVARRVLVTLSEHNGASGYELGALVRSRAAIHVALYRLEQAGMIRAEWQAPGHSPPAQRLYYLTAPGELEAVRLFHAGAGLG